MEYAGTNSTLAHSRTWPGKAAPATDDNYPLIVHSHLGWDWVWQRPQQFLSRLSKNHHVLFVEGPTPVEGIRVSEVILRETTDYPNIIVVQMKIPATRWKDGAWVDKERRRLLQSVLAGPLAATFHRPVQWFYDPMAVTAFAGMMNERAIVYDCMDELSLFRGAPAELVRRERELLAAADVVFAGGPKMWKAKREINPNCFCFGCGVDVEHFAKVHDRNLKLPTDMAKLPGPVFGYFGVVDERLDYDLIDRLARETKGSVAIVGPWTKIDPADLPKRDNLHWLGGRDYSDLPAYAKGFDICLMPFALNDATKFINPTKALEYMATGKPIVSTAIEDVVEQFSGIVSIARDAEEFTAKCQAAAKRPNKTAIARGLALARRNSWDSIVEQLETHISDALEPQQLETDAA